MTLLNATLDLANRGIPVVPCKPDNKPLTRHGFKDAATDTVRIQLWGGNRPEALIGVPTGKSDPLTTGGGHFFWPPPTLKGGHTMAAIETISVAQTGALINADWPPSVKTLRRWETELAFPKPRVIAYDKAKFLAWISRRAKA